MKILSKEPNVIKVGEPLVVVGDTHGQYYDLLTLLDRNRDPSDTNYLFLGDYVDRGVYGVEIMLLLLSIKVRLSIRTF